MLRAASILTVLALAALHPTGFAVAGQTEPIAQPDNPVGGPDVRYHLSYADAPAGTLVVFPGQTPDLGWAANPAQTCQLRKEVIEPLRTLFRKAREFENKVTDGWGLQVLSCARGHEYQKDPFCAHWKGEGLCQDSAIRSYKSAPPGYSEHATGYTLDFAIRAISGNLQGGRCAKNDTPPCVPQMQTQIGRWLNENGPTYGFELSFPCADPSSIDCPAGTGQGVAYEPWHWRWVGNADALKLFDVARTCFPANPGVKVTKAPSDIRACLIAKQARPWLLKVN